MFTPPEPTYVGLWIGSPLESGLGGAEVSGSGYTRVSGAPFVAVGLDDPTDIHNDSPIAFPVAVEGWGDVTHFTIHDALEGGNMLIYGELDSQPITIDLGSEPTFAIGKLKVILY